MRRRPPELDKRERTESLKETARWTLAAEIRLRET